MKITAITQDQIILIDGNPAQMILHGGFHMKNGEWAVQYDSIKELGEIEYLDNRQNQTIDKAFFDAHYSWLLVEHERVIAAEIQAAELAQLEVEQEAQAYEQQAAIANSVSVDSGIDN